MARELAPPREGVRLNVFLRLRRVKPEDIARLREHLMQMKSEWDLVYEVTQLEESDLPEGA